MPRIRRRPLRILRRRTARARALTPRTPAVPRWKPIGERRRGGAAPVRTEEWLVPSAPRERAKLLEQRPRPPAPRREPPISSAPLVPPKPRPRLEPDESVAKRPPPPRLAVADAPPATAEPDPSPAAAVVQEELRRFQARAEALDRRLNLIERRVAASGRGVERLVIGNGASATNGATGIDELSAQPS